MGGEYLRRRIGLDFRREPVRIRVKGKSILVAHGDGLGSGDAGYRVLRFALRAGVTRRLFRWVHPDVGLRIAESVSRTRSARAPGLGATSDGRTEFLSKWASEELERDATLDIVALGHAHLPLITEVAPGRFYVNSGDWVHHRSYVTIDDSGTPTLHDWRG